MFTGIIEELGTLADITPKPTGSRLTIQCSKVLEDATEGCSIAVNGVCLTALDIAGNSFSADLAPETLKRTNLGDLSIGAPLNLERPMQLNARLSGHIVQGHVDGTGELLSLAPLGDDNWWLTIRMPDHLLPLVVHKGSIALDGISLTIAELGADPNDSSLSVAIIPHTYEATNLKDRDPGSRINVEVDILAKHVERLLQFRRD